MKYDYWFIHRATGERACVAVSAENYDAGKDEAWQALRDSVETLSGWQLLSGKPSIFAQTVDMGLEDSSTPDRFKWMSSQLCYSELNAMMRELVD